MLSIRFNRTGKRNQAQFRIVVQEHTVAPGGRHVEVLGSYDPHSKKSVFRADRIKYWIGKGAQASDSVWNLLIKNQIIKGAKRAVKMKKKPVAAEKESVEQKPAEVKTEEKSAKESEEIKKEEKPEEAKTEKPETPKEEKKKEAEKPVEEKKAEEVKADKKTE